MVRDVGKGAKLGARPEKHGRRWPLQKHYDQMWQDASGLFKKDQYQLDRLIKSPRDTRRGVTVLSYLDHNNTLCDQIQAFLRKLHALEPEQYYYPNADLHLTVLSVISGEAGLALSDIDAKAYAEVLKEAARDAGPFKVHFHGVTASPACILIQGFPEDDQLERLRNSLRTHFGAFGLKTSIDSRYRQSSAHSTVCRLQAPLRSAEKWLETLEGYRDHRFGTLEVTEVDLVFNNWYQNRFITSLLTSCQLGAEPLSRGH